MVQETTQIEKGGISISTQDVMSDEIHLYFDIINDHSITIQNQITDNYLENNTAVQDHIAHSPITVTVSGLVGEKVFVPTDELRDEQLKKAQKATNTSPLNKLSKLTDLLPPVSNAMQIAQNAYDYVSASVNRYVGVFKSLKNSNSAGFGDLGGEERISRLEQIYSNLVSLNNSNTAFFVETPFKRLDNMYIQSLSFRQGNENYIGDISITLKQLRFGGVETTEANEEVMAKYNAYARAQVENNGKAQGKQTILKEMTDKFAGTTYGSGIKR